MEKLTDQQVAAVLSYFTGKALEKAAEAVRLLNASAEEGYWAPNASRKVPAALSKSPVAAKFAKAITKKFYPAHIERKIERDCAWYEMPECKVADHLIYGAFSGFGGKASSVESTDPEVAAFHKAYVAAFAPVLALARELEETKTKPVITKLGASPTVTKTLDSLEAADVNSPKYEWIKKEILVKGMKHTIWVPKIIWPEGTKHGTSRFHSSKVQCEACGHRISSGNWVPLVLTSKDGTPRSLWVGQDCAHTLFGIKVKGKLAIER